MADVPKCSRCGTELSPNAAQGLCPRCLIEMNLGPATEAPNEAGPHGTHITEPRSESISRTLKSWNALAEEVWAWFTRRVNHGWIAWSR
jgi:NMD protein affecting ribosome stability and mRNA decay